MSSGEEGRLVLMVQERDRYREALWMIANLAPSDGSGWERADAMQRHAREALGDRGKTVGVPVRATKRPVYE